MPSQPLAFAVSVSFSSLSASPHAHGHRARLLLGIEKPSPPAASDSNNLKSVRSSGNTATEEMEALREWI